MVKYFYSLPIDDVITLEFVLLLGDICMCHYAGIWCFLPLSGIFGISLVVRPIYGYIIIGNLVFFFALYGGSWNMCQHSEFFIFCRCWAIYRCVKHREFLLPTVSEVLGICITIWATYEYVIMENLVVFVIAGSILGYVSLPGQYMDTCKFLSLSTVFGTSHYRVVFCHY